MHHGYYYSSVVSPPPPPPYNKISFSNLTWLIFLFKKKTSRSLFCMLFFLFFFFFSFVFFLYIFTQKNFHSSSHTKTHTQFLLLLSSLACLPSCSLKHHPKSQTPHHISHFPLLCANDRVHCTGIKKHLLNGKMAIAILTKKNSTSITASNKRQDEYYVSHLSLSLCLIDTTFTFFTTHTRRTHKSA